MEFKPHFQSSQSVRPAAFQQLYFCRTSLSSHPLIEGVQSIPGGGRPRPGCSLQCSSALSKIQIGMTRNISSRFLLLLAASSAWLLMIPTAPYAAGSDNLLGHYIYLFFSPVCHQQPDRCFLYHGLPFAVCARCFGIYFGFFLGLLGSAMFSRIRRFILGHPKLILLFAFPMAWDVLATNNEWSRFTTGLTAAFPIAFFVHRAVEEIDFNLLRRIPR